MPLAVSGGVHDEHGAAKAVMCGASAVQVVSAALAAGPGRIATLAEGMERWMDEYGYASVEGMTGCMNIRRCPDPARLTRAQYVRSLRTWRAN